MHYVIGDVHGCYDELMQLLQKIESRDEDAKIILVGDLIDRGDKTMEVLKWAMENITEDGKYQCIRGNHEQMIIEWFYTDFNYWYLKDEDIEELPDTHYDFDELVIKHDLASPEKLRPYVEFFESLPYEKVVDVVSKNKRHIRFRVVHAWVDFGKDVPDRIQRHTHLWTRNFDGNQVNGEIIVHGHTPTLSIEYINKTNGHAKPGRISYQKNSINVDGGCYCKIFKGHAGRLCGICLETMEEFYSSTLEERLEELYLEAYAEEYPEREKILYDLLEQEKMEQERLEQERLEQERLEQERLEQEKLEQEKLEQDTADAIDAVDDGKSTETTETKPSETEAGATVSGTGKKKNGGKKKTRKSAKKQAKREAGKANKTDSGADADTDDVQMDVEMTVQNDLGLIHQEVDKTVTEYDALYGIEDEFRVKMLKRLGITSY